MIDKSRERERGRERGREGEGGRKRKREKENKRIYCYASTHVFFITLGWGGGEITSNKTFCYVYQILLMHGHD